MRIPQALRLVAVSAGRGSVADVEAFAQAVFDGGATAVWLRERERSADELREVVTRVRAIADRRDGAVIVSGADVASCAAGAHALQLGRHEPPAREVRERVGPDVVLGLSLHDPIDARALDVVDFAILAPVFAVPGKGPALGLARFRELAGRASVPIVALGGIDATNAATVVRAGACGIGVLRGIAGSRDPRRAARELRRALEGQS
ncbi:MAG: thiamine phosphate synthase [Planctomycetes bacterium]|nr:thiamine phosphate synthase [Planctomycetota bacterium]MCC7171033.1 thiamine phosphate synthase [Planctomycetota bacterium]